MIARIVLGLTMLRSSVRFLQNYRSCWQTLKSKHLVNWWKLILGKAYDASFSTLPKLFQLNSGGKYLEKFMKDWLNRRCTLIELSTSRRSTTMMLQSNLTEQNVNLHEQCWTTKTNLKAWKRRLKVVASYVFDRSITRKLLSWTTFSKVVSRNKRNFP